MTRRVIIQGGGSSPLRVSASGVDAASAEFNTLIFDGNQPPLRLWGTGYVACDGMSWNEFTGGQNIREGSPVSVFAAPAGHTPIFCVLWRGSDVADGHLVPPGYQSSANTVEGGAGGAICNGNTFVPVCFRVGAPGAPTVRPAICYVNYAVFRNFQ